MAACRCTLLISSSTLFPSYSTGRRITLKVIRRSSVSARFPLKSSKRKNYLRPKILRTLKPKPHETDLIKINTPEDVPPSDLLSNKSNVVEELQISSSSVASNELNGITGKLSPELVAKYGWYLLGILAFQTVCAFWFLGSSNESMKTPENSNDSCFGAGTADRRNSSSYVPLLVNRKYSNGKNGQGASNVVFLDELEMNEKIAEIRVMAREARESEQKSGKNELEDTLDPSGGMDIEKEIGTRLADMKKQLNSQRKGLAGLRVEPVNEFGNADGRKGNLEDVKGNEKDLMFEKKYKFKTDKPSSDVKGFGGSRRNNEISSRNVQGFQDIGKIGTDRNGSDSQNGKKNPEEQQNEARHEDSKLNSGAAQESQPSHEVKKPRKPNLEAASGFGKKSLPGQNKEVTRGKPMRRDKEKQSDTENRIWWLKLPYVLRILMRSNIDQEISEGYFTLKTDDFVEQNRGQVSHIIGFEDQIDARNFSYLLESFFEDLGDFSADVIPISTKDLHEEVSSGGKNVLIVKKKQLALYAGQPFEDVERALRDLIQGQ